MIQFFGYYKETNHIAISSVEFDKAAIFLRNTTEDARLRAEKISEFSGGKLGKLESARMGIFQIMGQNSKENHSWGGTYNTTSRKKTASITMKLTYKID